MASKFQDLIMIILIYDKTAEGIYSYVNEDISRLAALLEFAVAFTGMFWSL
jgi:hypothetical protein